MKRWVAFRSWKRDAYLARTCALMHYYLEGQHVEHRIKSVIMAWRKYAYLRRNKAQFISHFEQKRNQRTRQIYLSQWYSCLMKNLPTRVLVEKVDQVSRNHLLRTAMTQIAKTAIERNHSQGLAN